MDNSELHNHFGLHSLYQKGQPPIGQIPFNNLMMTVSQMANNAPQIADEPLYVNAKQYHRILKRREARARQQANSRLQRKEKGKQAYMHESRHKHAMRRPRGPGGRFLSASEMAALEAQEKLNAQLEQNLETTTDSDFPNLAQESKKLRDTVELEANVSLDPLESSKEDFAPSTPVY